MFKHQWIPKVSNPYVESAGPVDVLDFRVADLIDEVNFEWRKPLLEVLFPGEIIPRILAIHIPRVTRQDELIWRLSKNGEFSVKCANFEALRTHTGCDGVGRGDEVWRKVWGLNLPPKLALFLWKVLHKIIPTKVVLFRRGMAGDMVCPVCGRSDETIEHLFFECEFGRRLWRASSLGLDFIVGSPVSFKEWLLEWVREVPDKSAVVEGIYLLWAVWCARNRVVFDRINDGVVWGLQIAMSVRNGVGFYVAITETCFFKIYY